MPVPVDKVFQNLSKLQFISHNIHLPFKWPGWDKHYLKAFAKSELSVALAALSPSTAAFMSHTVNAYHAATQKKISQLHFDFMDGISGSIIKAWQQFHSLSTLTNITVNGAVAAGGKLVGPNLEPLIFAQAPKKTAMHLLYSKVISHVIGDHFQKFIDSIKVPALPWYPSFAMFPGPMAPPTPNVPAMLQSLIHVPALVQKDMVGKKMIAVLNAVGALHSVELFDGVAAAFEKCVNMWMSTTQITQVLAQGPVPSFSPPTTPAGPVVSGIANMIPGGFI
jgi:hypothetical protein